MYNLLNIYFMTYGGAAFGTVEYGGRRVDSTKEKILALIKEHEQQSVKQLSEALNISLSMTIGI